MTCAFHAADSICDRCPERFDTDGKGFPHPAERKGRQALRVCKGCEKALPIARFDLSTNWFRCMRCTCNAENLTPISAHDEHETDSGSGKFPAVARETDERDVRFCTPCLARNLRVIAPFVAASADGAEWFECGDHDVRDNVSELVRVSLTPLDEWRRAHGLPF